MKKLLYNLARKIIVSRMIAGTQLTSKYLEDRGWVYRDGYFVDPKANDEKRVSIKFQNPGTFEKIHYYRVYHCIHIVGEKMDPEALTLIAREMSVEWLEMYLLCINKKPERLI